MPSASFLFSVYINQVPLEMNRVVARLVKLSDELTAALNCLICRATFVMAHSLPLSLFQLAAAGVGAAGGGAGGAATSLIVGPQSVRQAEANSLQR